LRALDRALTAHGIAAEAFKALDFGETVTV
jgi:hypothetical protein